VPAQDAAVALVFRPAPAAQGLVLTQDNAVRPEEVPDRLAGFLDAVAERVTAPATLLAGRRVLLTPAIRARVGRVRRAPDGGVSTALWAGAYEHAADATPGGTVLAEYDPDLRYLCLAAFESAVEAC
jgi:hypothetical protein